MEALHNVKGYALVKNYSQIFGPDNEYNEESIFEVNFTSNLENEGSALANLFAPTGEGPTLGNCGSCIQPEYTDTRIVRFIFFKMTSARM